jgi:hypothetical protein
MLCGDTENITEMGRHNDINLPTLNSTIGSLFYVLQLSTTIICWVICYSDMC